MQSPDQKPKKIKEDVEEERLRLWREKRAKVAEKSKQERIKLAETERRERLKLFEIEKAQRIKDAAEQRAQAEALKQAERMALARSKIAGRTDIEAARNRLMAYRQKSLRKMALKVSLFVVLPTVLAAIYLFNFATPLYSSQVKFSLAQPGNSTETSSLSAIANTQISREAHLLRQVIYSPKVQLELDDKNRFTEHFMDDSIDVLTRFPSPLSIRQNEHPSHTYIDVSVNGQDGLINIKTKATDPRSAQNFAQTVLDQSRAWIEQGSDGNEAPSLYVRVLVEPTLENTPSYPAKLSTLALVLFGLTTLYALFSIFGRTLIRHGQH